MPDTFVRVPDQSTLPNFGLSLFTVSPDRHLCAVTTDLLSLSEEDPLDASYRRAVEAAGDNPILPYIPYQLLITHIGSVVGKVHQSRVGVHSFLLYIPDPCAPPKSHNLETPVAALGYVDVHDRPDLGRIPVLLSTVNIPEDVVERIFKSTLVELMLRVTHLAEQTNNLYPEGVPIFDTDS
jgi:hypothetical protein